MFITSIHVITYISMNSCLVHLYPLFIMYSIYIYVYTYVISINKYANCASRHLLQLNSYSSENLSSPVRVPITIISNTSLNNMSRLLSAERIRQLASLMGDEWKRLAAILNVRKVRIQVT